MPSNLGPAPCNRSASSYCLTPQAHPERSENWGSNIICPVTLGAMEQERDRERESWPPPVAESRRRLHMVLSFKPCWSYPLVNNGSISVSNASTAPLIMLVPRKMGKGRTVLSSRSEEVHDASRIMIPSGKSEWKLLTHWGIPVFMAV